MYVLGIGQMKVCIVITQPVEESIKIGLGHLGFRDVSNELVWAATWIRFLDLGCDGLYGNTNYGLMCYTNYI